MSPSSNGLCGLFLGRLIAYVTDLDLGHDVKQPHRRPEAKRENGQPHVLAVVDLVVVVRDRLAAVAAWDSGSLGRHVRFLSQA